MNKCISEPETVLKFSRTFQSGFSCVVSILFQIYRQLKKVAANVLEHANCKPCLAWNYGPVWNSVLKN